jgi:hypothetical protein
MENRKIFVSFLSPCFLPRILTHTAIYKEGVNQQSLPYNSSEWER